MAQRPARKLVARLAPASRGTDMGRYSPTVLPDAPDPNAAWEGLAHALGTYAASRDYEKAQKEHDQDRAHMQQSQRLGDAIQQANARQAGITPGTAPHEDLDITVPDGLPPSEDHLPFDRAMQPHPQGLASALSGQFDRAGGMRPPSSAPTTPGAFSIAGGGFHSPLKDQMSGGGAAPMSEQPAGGGAPAPSHTLHMTPSYQQLTPDYYMDRTAPGPVGSALARELGQRKGEAEIDELGARAAYLREHGDYFEQGGYGGRGGAGAPHTLRTPNGYMLWDPQSRTYIPVDDENGKPVMPVLPRASTALPPQVRSARSAATASRSDATSFDRRASSYEKPLNDPTRRVMGDTADFPALRDSMQTYRDKADSARSAASGFDAQANRGSGVSAPPVLSGQPRNSTPPAQRYTRKQIESFYQDAIARGAKPADAAARRDSLLKTASP